MQYYCIHTSIGLIACKASTLLFFQNEYHNLVNRPSLESKLTLFLNEVVAKFALIAAEEVEERVESVQDSKEDKLSSAGDSEGAESSSVGTKTDDELIEKLLPGVYAVIVDYFKLQEKLIADVNECAFHKCEASFPQCVWQLQ